MKKLVSTAIAAVALCTAPAFAADMPAKAPVYKAPPAPVWNWTGFYLGAYAGVGVNQSHGFDPTGVSPGDIEYLGTGFTGGLTGGYNWQLDPHWVVGLEGDIGYLGLDHESQQYDDSPPPLRVNSKTSWIGTLRGRVGYSNGPTLTYITGGPAWVHFDDTLNFPADGTLESAKTKLGYAVGSGVETRLGGNWTVKSESLFVDVGGGDTLALPVGGYVAEADKHRYSVQRFGVNYLFGGKPTGPLPQEHWQGFFVGAVGGTAVTETRVSATAGTTGEFGNTGTGFNLGLIAGYNWQFAPQWVAGVEGDFSWLGIKHSLTDYNDPVSNYELNTRWLATARGRLGYSTGPALLYVTGGAAWVNYEENWRSPVSASTSSSTTTSSGYAVGGGIETGFTLFGLLGPGLLARSEYLYVNVGDGDTLTPPVGGYSVVANHQFHLFRGAVVYRFGG